MAGKREGKPTLADVAREAGVSVMTVSNVVNGRDDLVRDVTRERVDRAVEQLGYRPNINARALRLDRGWAVGLLIITHRRDYASMNWMSNVIAGLSSYLDDHDYGLLLSNQSPERLDESPLLKRIQTDGLVVMTSGSDSHRQSIFEKLSRLQQPIIALQETLMPESGQDMAVVKEDDFNGGEMLAEHLHSKKASNLVFIESDFAWVPMKEKADGLRAGLKPYPHASLRVIQCKDEALESVERAVLDDIKQNGLPDAFIGGNDLISLAALTALETAGYEVPREVLLAGFSVADLWSLATRRITRISASPYDIGKQAGRLLLDRLSGDRFQKGLEVLPVTLEIGDTTGSG